MNRKKIIEMFKLNNSIRKRNEKLKPKTFLMECFCPNFTSTSPSSSSDFILIRYVPNNRKPQISEEVSLLLLLSIILMQNRESVISLWTRKSFQLIKIIEMKYVVGEWWMIMMELETKTHYNPTTCTDPIPGRIVYYLHRSRNRNRTNGMESFVSLDWFSIGKPIS